MTHDSDMLVIAVQDGVPEDAPITYSNFRLLFPDTSFPDTVGAAWVEPFGYAMFQRVPAPVVGQFQTVTAGPIAWDASAAAWVDTWVVAPFTDDEMAAAEARQIATLTQSRNQRLMACDWTQLPDVPLSPTDVANWRAYRQQLRNYLDRVTDPFNPPAFPAPPVTA
jgi:hypothetical protein